MNKCVLFGASNFMSSKKNLDSPVFFSNHINWQKNNKNSVSGFDVVFKITELNFFFSANQNEECWIKAFFSLVLLLSGDFCY